MAVTGAAVAVVAAGVGGAVVPRPIWLFPVTARCTIVKWWHEGSAWGWREGGGREEGGGGGGAEI